MTTTLTLTPEQDEAIVAKARAEFDKQVKQLEKQKAKEVASLKRRADDRVFRARQRATAWKAQYSDTRSKLLAAQAEIVILKRRLRNGDWDE